MPKFITLGEHKFVLPQMPARKSDILFSDLKKEDQFWRRQTDFPIWLEKYTPLTKLNASKTEYDEDDNLIMLNVDDTRLFLELRKREMLRRWNGIWFMNNGEPTYLTGGHYFMLQWGKMPGYTNDYEWHPDFGSSFGVYREFQAHTHYFLQLCKQDRNCGGGFILKPKKTGITNLIALDYLDEATKYTEKIFGMMSKSKPDCQITGFRYFKHAMQELPMMFLPQISNDNESEVRFGAAKIKRTGTSHSILKQANAGKGFNSIVFAAATKADGFDGPVMFRGWLDEFPKLEDPYPGEVFKKTSETVKIGSKINGKLWISSYTPESDGKSLEQAMKVYDDSSLSTVTAGTGRTKSEIYKYFISALDSFEEYLDRYGKTEARKVNVYIEAKRDQLKGNPEDLKAFERQYPRTEDECWRAGGSGVSRFDNVRLGMREKVLQEKLKAGDVSYVEGRLEFTGKFMASAVRFVPRTEEELEMGTPMPFRFYYLDKYDPKYFNVLWKRMTATVENDQAGTAISVNPFVEKKPQANCPWIGGMDPTDFVEAEDVASGSKNGIAILPYPDIALDTSAGFDLTRRQFCRYLFRHNNPKDTLHDVVKLIFFLGCEIYIETNKPWLVTQLKALGLQKYCLVRDPAKGLVPYGSTANYKLPATTNIVIDNYCNEIATSIAVPEDPGEEDPINYLEDEVYIAQLKKFDPTNTKKSDLVVCNGLALLALKARSFFREKRQKEGGDEERNIMVSAMNSLVKGN